MAGRSGASAPGWPFNPSTGHGPRPGRMLCFLTHCHGRFDPVWALAAHYAGAMATPPTAPLEPALTAEPRAGAASPGSPFVPVNPAGGSGTRLWPLSRRARPKFLLDLTGGGSSLLQQTVARLAPLADRAPIVVTGAAHAEAVRAQVGQAARVLVEPSPRNSMPAIALAAAVAEAEDPDAVIGSFAADHLISDVEGFSACVLAARRAAELGYLATIGIAPTHPATGYGYIEQGPARRDAPAGGDGDGAAADDRPGQAASGLPPLEGTGALPVARFVEKPDATLAREFYQAGTFRWNAGMFVVRARVLLEALDELMPQLSAGARRIAAACGTAEEEAVTAREWPALTAIAIDHALAEPLALRGRVAMVPGSFGWDDVGDFAALARQLRAPGADAGASADGSDVVVLGGAETAALTSRATVYGAGGRVIALVGLDRITVVDTPDALLVLADDHAQDLSALGAQLDAAGYGELR